MAAIEFSQQSYVKQTTFHAPKKNVFCNPSETHFFSGCSHHHVQDQNVQIKTCLSSLIRAHLNTSMDFEAQETCSYNKNSLAAIQGIVEEVFDQLFFCPHLNENDSNDFNCSKKL